MLSSSIYDARNNLSSLIKVAEVGNPVELTRHEKPVAVLISYEDYKSQCSETDFFTAINAIKDKYKDVLSEFSDKDLSFSRNRECPNIKKIEELFN